LSDPSLVSYGLASHLATRSMPEPEAQEGLQGRGHRVSLASHDVELKQEFVVNFAPWVVLYKVRLGAQKLMGHNLQVFNVS
jgi:hypothetical protein